MPRPNHVPGTCEKCRAEVPVREGTLRGPATVGAPPRIWCAICFTPTAKERKRAKEHRRRARRTLYEARADGRALCPCGGRYRSWDCACSGNPLTCDLCHLTWECSSCGKKV